MNLLAYFQDNTSEIINLIFQHLQITVLAVVAAIAIGVPLGILISYIKKVGPPILGAANIIQAIPSLALLGFLIPFLGIGFKPALFMVVLYSLLPIIKNTATGLDNISSDLVEAATGIGMTPFQVLYKVKLPLALPVIMAGVRISAVTAVGLVTIAAFIGAGGLGYLVYSGIRTVNNAQILAGAIPACLMALGIDFLVAQVEKAVSPISLRADIKSLDKARITVIRRKQRVGLAATSFVLVAIIGVGLVSGIKTNTKSITIGAKDFTEQNIVGNIYAELIEAKTDIDVNRRLDLGGTQIVFTALTSGELDMYIEYTGTIYGSVLKETEARSSEEIYKMTCDGLESEYNIAVLSPIGFNNTFAIAVRPDTAKEYNLTCISDLAKVSKNMKASPTLEFMNRADGIQGLQEIYRMEFGSLQPLDGTPRYSALVNKQSDVIDVYATDGLIREFDLVVLEDDRGYFPAYDAVPLVRPEILEKYPELVEVLNLLAGEINDDTMREMNYQVDVLKMRPEDVAVAFLQEKGLFD